MHVDTVSPFTLLAVAATAQSPSIRLHGEECVRVIMQVTMISFQISQKFGGLLYSRSARRTTI